MYKVHLGELITVAFTTSCSTCLSGVVKCLNVSVKLCPPAVQA